MGTLSSHGDTLQESGIVEGDTPHKRLTDQNIEPRTVRRMNRGHWGHSPRDGGRAVGTLPFGDWGHSLGMMRDE